MDAKPKRRWYQFSLRTMLVLVTVTSGVFGWVGYSLRWIQQRNEMRLGQPTLPLHKIPSPFPRSTAPAWLGLFGEEGTAVICWYPGSPFNLEQAKHLFPEAEVLEFT